MGFGVSRRRNARISDRPHAGAEIDLVLFRHGPRIGVAPDRAFIVYPGRERYRLHEKVEVVPLVEVPRLLVHRRGA